MTGFIRAVRLILQFSQSTGALKQTPPPPCGMRHARPLIVPNALNGLAIISRGGFIVTLSRHTHPDSEESRSLLFCSTPRGCCYRPQQRLSRTVARPGFAARASWRCRAASPQPGPGMLPGAVLRPQPTYAVRTTQVRLDNSRKQPPPPQPWRSQSQRPGPTPR